MYKGLLLNGFKDVKGYLVNWFKGCTEGYGKLLYGCERTT